jgi:hypothetical protein
VVGRLRERQWLAADNQSQSPGAAQDFSFDTPLGAMDAGAKQGRVVYSDMHVGATPPGVQQDYGGGTGTTPTAAPSTTSPRRRRRWSSSSSTSPPA